MNVVDGAPEEDAAAKLDVPREVSTPKSAEKAPATPQAVDNRKVEDDVAAEPPADIPAFADDTAAANEPVEEDPIVADTMAKVADLTVSEPAESEVPAVEIIPQDAPSEAREADNVPSFVETSLEEKEALEDAKATKEPNLLAQDKEATATNAANGSAPDTKLEDEQETW